MNGLPLAGGRERGRRGADLIGSDLKVLAAVVVCGVVLVCGVGVGLVCIMCCSCCRCVV